MDIVYKDFNILSENQVMSLYQDLQWKSYTDDIKKLLFGIQKSSFVYSAWDQNQLVGLIRVVSDGYTICYIQDILVKNDYQRQGIGSKLMKKVMNKYEHVRQIVLTTDIKSKSSIAFYKKFGFKVNKDFGCVSLMRLKDA